MRGGRPGCRFVSAWVTMTLIVGFFIVPLGLIVGFIVIPPALPLLAVAAVLLSVVTGALLAVLYRHIDFAGHDEREGK